MQPPRKRRRIDNKAVEEVPFDPAARQEYLTGFHKRKLQRTKHAQELALKKARAERVEERRKLREGRKADLERHVQEVNSLLKLQQEPVPNGEGDVASEDSDQWSGISEPWEPPEIDREAEYIDEDKYTSVTIDEVDVTREGLQAANGHQTNGRDVEVDKLPSDNIAGGGDGKQKKHKWTKEKPRDKVNVGKKKRTKFRYESKAERKVTRVKDKARKSQQARARRAG